MGTLNIFVRQQTGTYQTNTVRGQRASCTYSAKIAAETLGKKLYGDRFVRAEEVPMNPEIVGTKSFNLVNTGAA